MSLLAFPLSVSRSEGRYSDFSAYPATKAGWDDRYDRLWCAYLGEPYDLSEVKNYHLFRALDDDNKEIDQTRRVFAAGRFIVDTDVGGVLGGGRVVLEVEDGLTDATGAPASDEERAALLVAGEAIWKRSCVVERAEGWVRTAASLGDLYIEAVRVNGAKPYRTTLVAYDPRNVTPYYDAITNTRLEKVVIEKGYIGADKVAADGVIDDDTPHTYRREITATRVDVYVDGVHQPKLSGEHGAGVVPVVHLQFIPFTEPDHGLPATPPSLDEAMRMCDSLATQGKAIGTRFANPIGYIFGVKLPEGSAISRFGRWLSNAPADAKAGYVEPTGNLAQQLREQVDQILDHVRRTCPEFMFADNEVNVSGESMAAKASAFESKIGGVRARLFGGLCRITAIAVAMDADQVADPDRIVYRIDAGPILPKNAKSELEQLNSIRDLLTPGDVVRHLQRLKWVGLHEDPDEYAKRVGEDAVRKALADAVKAAAPKPAEVQP